MIRDFALGSDMNDLIIFACDRNEFSTCVVLKLIIFLREVFSVDNKSLFTPVS